MQQEGLAAALLSYIDQVTHGGLQINLDADSYVRQSVAQEEALYRIAQEALNNLRGK